MKGESTSWEGSKDWYGGLVGEKGHYYHQSVILPNANRLLDLKPGDSLLDLGCGQGVFARHVPAGVSVTGVDASASLIQEAKKRTPSATFKVADVTAPLPLSKKDFTHALFLLSLQNMENGEAAIERASFHLAPKGRLLLVLNHPCFRIARQSSWGIDEGRKLQYRRMDLYLSSQKIPIQTHPGKGGETTLSFHSPLSLLFSWLGKAGLSTIALEEWISDKKSEGPKAKMEDRARREFPLFLALLARK